MDTVGSSHENSVPFSVGGVRRAPTSGPLAAPLSGALSSQSLECPDTLLPQVSIRCHLPREGSPDRLWKITPPTPSLHFIFVIAPARHSPTFWNVSVPLTSSELTEHERQARAFCSVLYPTTENSNEHV